MPFTFPDCVLISKKKSEGLTKIWREVERGKGMKRGGGVGGWAEMGE